MVFLDSWNKFDFGKSENHLNKQTGSNQLFHKSFTLTLSYLLLQFGGAESASWHNFTSFVFASIDQ